MNCIPRENAMTTQQVSSHPVIACAHSIEKTLESVADVQPCYMTTTDKQGALLALARAEARIAELKLRVLATADDVAEQTGARDAGGWLAHHTHIDHPTPEPNWGSRRSSTLATPGSRSGCGPVR